MASETDFEETINSNDSNDSYSFEESDDHSEISKTENSTFILMNLDDSPGASQDSLAEEGKIYNQMQAKVNMAYKNYKISEFILNTYKEIANSNRHALQKPAKLVNDTILSYNLENSITLKSRNGEIVNFLGLDDCYTEIKNDLTLVEQYQLKDNLLESLKEQIKATQLKRQCVKEIFAEHYPKQADVEEDIPCKYKVIRFSHMYNSLEDKIYQLKSVLHQIEVTVEELFNVQQSSQIKEQELKKYSMVFTKVKYMKNITSLLEEKANVLLNQNRSRTEYLNTQGKEHEQNVNMLRKKVNSMKTSIDIYKRKERLSSSYAQLVKEYNKMKLNLKGKQQTLCLLNEAHAARFLNQMHP